MARLSQMFVSGRYRLQLPLGKGTIGITHRAEDRRTGDLVALKVLRRSDPTARALLIQEFLVLRGVKHPHVAEVRDFVVGLFDDERRPCLVSRFVPGVTLDAYAKDHDASFSRRALVGILSALAYLHGRGTVHGDVKASNVIVGPDGETTLIDFGCARPIGLYPTVYGTLDHLSPEAMTGEACPEADLYALGISLSKLAWMDAYPEEVARLAARMVAKDRAQRPTAAAALDALGARESLALPTAERASRWVGHERELEKVEAAIAAAEPGRIGPRLIAIGGPRGVGRSRFLLELRLRMAPHFDVFESDSRDLHPVETMLSLALGSGPISGIARSLDAMKTLAERRPPTLLLLDDIERTSEAGFQALAAVARSLPADGRLVFVVTGDRRLEDVSALDVVLPNWREEHVAEWLGEPAPPAGLARLKQLSLGLPKRVVQLAGTRPSALLTPHAVERRNQELMNSGAAPSEDADPVLEAILASGGELSLRLRSGGKLGLERDAPLAIAVARVFQDSGEPQRALSVVARALRRRPSSEDAARLRALAGGVALRRGDTRRALRRLRRSFDEASPGDRPAVAKDLALALLRSGDPKAALDVTLAVEPVDAETRADLACSRAVAEAYLGREQEAEQTLARVGEEGTLAPRTRVRLESARGHLATRRGRIHEAATVYGRALALAESASLDDLIVQTALNAGTASHAAGDLGVALRAYERGEAMARATAATAAGITLGFNRGKLLGDIGAFEQSEAVLKGTLARATREKMSFFEGVCHQALADGRMVRGDLDGAERSLERAMKTLTPLAAERELGEADVLAAEIALARGDSRPAETVVTRAEKATAPDVSARAHRALAQALERRKDLPLAAKALEDALRLAEESGQALLVAEIASARARTLDARGASYLAARDAGRAREIWEGIAIGLPSPFDRVFREHPQRRELFANPAPVRAPGPENRPDARASDRLRHLVAINRRIGSASTSTEILEATLDAAIDLTRAERGFLLLRSGADLRVAAARNFDQERVARSRAKFSHAVAKRVLARGEPVIAVDAGSDPRFSGSRSVHALELKSILCVPISGTAGVVGALYIDFRFRSGAFDEDDVDVVRAFADQAAIALERAELLLELQTKNLALEAERAQLALLADGRAAEIQELHGRLADNQRPVRERDYDEIIGRGPAMSKVLDLLDRVVSTDLTVLIEGESGTGKELVARAIHRHSARQGKPFLTVNCGALPPALFEGELFGYRKGAFTGAAKDHAGLFLAADGGTLLLDELGELPLDLQVKLLRVLQEKEVQPLGAPGPVSIDVRILCATHRDLRQRVRDGEFREDLYYRVAVVTIPLPPLRARIEDLPVLARGILAKAAETLRRPAPTLDRGAERALLRHPFPGNVRELENVLTKALLLSDGDVIREADLGLVDGSSGPPVQLSPRPRGGTPAEAARFRTVLEATGWNVCEAARALEMPRATFYRKLRRYRLERP
jgi:transcriptional regulator with GAF, ATPase, and Fis domain